MAFLGTRAIVPTSLKPSMLSKVATCFPSVESKPPEIMLSPPVPTRPWQFISQDLFEFQQKQYLVTVDHYSDFYELELTW